jgi:Uma2 family endonuclease
MVTKVGRRMTVEEYLALPEEPPYLEYVDGEAVQKAMPDRDHMLLVNELGFHLTLYSRQSGGISGPEGRVRFETPAGPEYRLPDYAYWAPGRPQGEGPALLPPTLAIEVRSPDETMAEQREKCRYLRDHGVEVCWLVNPASRGIEVFEGDRDAEPLAYGALLTSGHLPGFSLDPAVLWAVLPLYSGDAV